MRYSSVPEERVKICLKNKGISKEKYGVTVHQLTVQ